MKRRILTVVLAVLMLFALSSAALADHTHEYEAHLKLPTCTQEGSLTYVCAICGDIKEGQTYPALGHDWDEGSVTKAPTCAEPGEKTFSCSRCTETRTEAVPATGAHTYQNGVCAVCGKQDPCPSVIFTDVSRHDDTAHPDHVYHAAIDWAVTKEITNGTSKTTFGPHEGCTRAQAVTFLWRAQGCPKPSSADNPFKDLEQGAYYVDAVLWAAENGITNGTSETTFSPNATCTRAQIVTFLWRALEEPAPTAKECQFQDVVQGSYYYNAVLWAVEHNVTNGTSTTAFSPNATCTRAQIVTFFYRTAQDLFKD